MANDFIQSDFFSILEGNDPNIAPPVVNSLPEETPDPAAESVSPLLEESKDSASLVYTRKLLQRAVLAWVAEQAPTAAAIHVPTRLARFYADAAAFWSVPARDRLLHPSRTLIVQTCLARQDCWPGCSGEEDVIRHLRETRGLKTTLEEQIRKEEPQLRDSDMLFPEFESWDYTQSSNKDYHVCMQTLSDCERMLYQGTRYELILRAQVANEQYLAVPEGILHPDELASGWGLLYVKQDLTVEVIREAEVRNCPQENMLHLSQNIAASSLHDVLFANGVMLSGGKAVILRPPKRRTRLFFS